MSPTSPVLLSLGLLLHEAAGLHRCCGGRRGTDTGQTPPCSYSLSSLSLELIPVGQETVCATRPSRCCCVHSTGRSDLGVGTDHTLPRVKSIEMLKQKASVCSDATGRSTRLRAGCRAGCGLLEGAAYLLVPKRFLTGPAIPHLVI